MALQIHWTDLPQHEGDSAWEVVFVPAGSSAHAGKHAVFEARCEAELFVRTLARDPGQLDGVITVRPVR